jgi:hypothetical protein
MKKLLALFIFLAPFTILAQLRLSPDAEIRILTCGPGQNELYSAFGHSAVRVYDPVKGLDILYNYGVFDFDQPNFYLNFTKGNLLYKLAVTDYNRFVQSYAREGRFVHEQILNLNQAQAQAYFTFLQINALPQNTTYTYNYFYDNCATRIRDGLLKSLGPQKLAFDSAYVTESNSIRDLCDAYLKQQPWGDLGIDLCLGLPMDKEATAFEYMFLPDYLEAAFTEARVATNNGFKPLVKETVITYPGANQATTVVFTPSLFMWLLLLVAIALSGWQWRSKKSLRWIDFSLFITVGIIGSLLTVLWFYTNHEAARTNFNIMWALPLHLLTALTFLNTKLRNFLTPYFLALGFWHMVVALVWFLLPQDLNGALFPLNILLLLRLILAYRIGKTKKASV